MLCKLLLSHGVVVLISVRFVTQHLPCKLTFNLWQDQYEN